MIEIKARFNPISYEKPPIKRQPALLILQAQKKIQQNNILPFSFGCALQCLT